MASETLGPADRERLAALGQRLARRRAAVARTQADLAEEAGVSVSTVKRLEAGESVQLANLVRVLRALGALDDLERVAEEPPVRPLDEVRRPRGRRAETGGGWKWGDERDGERAEDDAR